MDAAGTGTPAQEPVAVAGASDTGTTDHAPQIRSSVFARNWTAQRPCRRSPACFVSCGQDEGYRRTQAAFSAADGEASTEKTIFDSGLTSDLLVSWRLLIEVLVER